MPKSPTPPPPVADGTGLPWDVPIDPHVDAVAAIAAARARHGDTFAVISGGDHYLFTFTPTGVESFYALPEDVASKGVADYLMLRRKLPDEIFDGRRVLPGSLFRRDDVASYLTNLHWALDKTIAQLGSRGATDLFALTRRLGHRMGLASWAGAGSADGDAFERLVSAFDALDGSEAFVHPDAMAAVTASGKQAERAALDEVVTVVADEVHRLESETHPEKTRSEKTRSEKTDAGLFGRIVDAWAGEPADPRIRGIGLDVALIHIASMSNLMAALGWAMVDLLEHPAELDAVIAGDSELAQRCALESTRLAQRSIMSRAVLAPVDLDTGDVTYRVPAGWTIATLLPLLNISAAPGLDRWNPARWHRHRLVDQDELPSPMLVTAFGHGRHTCPAQSFSLAAMTSAMTRLLGHYRMTPRWTSHPQPVPEQIGGVARAAGRCPVHYVPRGDSP